MNKLKYLFFAGMFLSMFTVQAQQMQRLSLKEVIDMARNQSLSAQQATTLLENKYWQYRTYRSNYFPQLNLTATLPDFTRSIVPVTQENGSFQFREVSWMQASTGLNLSQNIPWTGGQIFVNSRIQRIDNFSPEDQTSYSTNPLTVGINQPLFGFNPFRWDRKIEPLRYEESQKEYVEQLEQISVDAVNNYFDLLIAQIQFEIAKKNVANNDTLYRIAQGRYNLGKIAENELLQLELSLMNSQQDQAQAELNKQVALLQLTTFLGLDTDDKLQLDLPESIPDFEVDMETAQNAARDNRQAIIAFKRRKLEAERDLAKAKGDAGLNANLFASLGLTQQAQDIEQAYMRPQDQQSVRVGLSIPLLDWGRNRSKIKTAQANAKLVNANVKQQEENFDREIFLQVKQFEMLRKQLEVARKSDQIAQKRYDIAKNRYLIGKIAITDLNIATQEKDSAKRGYIQSLKAFWQAYYQLRKLTLYDFESRMTISIPQAGGIVIR